MGYINLTQIKRFVEKLRLSEKNSKWVISFLILLIIVAFNIGGKTALNHEKVNKLEEKINKLEQISKYNTYKIDSLKKDFDYKIQKGYQDGISILETQQNSFKEQLLFIINYKNEDKELLKNAINLKNEYTEDYIKKTVELSLKDLDNYQKKLSTSKKFNKINVSNSKDLDTLIKNYKIIKIEQLDDNSYLVVYQ